MGETPPANDLARSGIVAVRGIEFMSSGPRETHLECQPHAAAWSLPPAFSPIPSSSHLRSCLVLAVLLLVRAFAEAAPRPATPAPGDGTITVLDPGLSFEPRIPVGNVDAEAFAEW